jgi:hypothetical protein
MTVVHVTHRSDEFMESDRILGLHAGSIGFDGTPGEFMAQAESDRFQAIWSPLHRFRRQLLMQNVPLDPPPPGAWNDVGALLRELVSR